jgi:hypothetical protein
MASIPETRYAKTGDLHIAYLVMGDAPLVFVPGFILSFRTPVWGPTAGSVSVASHMMATKSEG